MLRNAIVHRPNRGGQPIADPRPDVVRQIEAIRSALVTAPALTAVLGRGVTVTSVDAGMAEASRRMLEGDFSQLPVMSDGRVVDLLTTDAVSRWMTTELIDHGQVRLDAPVWEVVPFDADRSYEVVDRSADVLTALDLFARHQERGEMLHAVLTRSTSAATRCGSGSVVSTASTSSTKERPPLKTARLTCGSSAWRRSTSLHCGRRSTRRLASIAQVSSWLGQSLETTMLNAHPSAEAIHRRVGARWSTKS